MLKILTNLTHPLVDEIRNEVKREQARPQTQPTIIEGLGRALRKNTSGLLHSGATALEADITEISSFTPWRNYGARLEESVRKFKAVSIHVETSTDERPSTIAIGSCDGATLIFRIPMFRGRNVWESFRKGVSGNGPIGGTTIVIKITSTF